jgi:diguanylate cyclase (GGDEF)-like protein
VPASLTSTLKKAFASDLCCLLGLIVLYWGADTLLSDFALGDGWQIFWPLNGLNIALLISQPRRRWPWLLAGIELGTGLSELLQHNTFTTTLVQRTLSMSEVLLSAWLLPPVTTLYSWLRTPNLYFRFAAAVTVGPLVTGLLAAVYFHRISSESWLSAFTSWGVADAIGIAAVLPLALAFGAPEARAAFTRRRPIVSTVTLAGALLIATSIFTTSHYPLIFILYPLLMLVDWLLGVLGSTIMLCAACIVAVFLTEHGYGPFAHPERLGMSRESALQLYLGFHLMGFLPVSILFLEQRRMAQELRRALARAAAQAAVDSLTGIANRRTLDQRLEEDWRRAMRTQTPLALMMIDVDHFKQFNDAFGHRAGDDCLRAIAQALTQHVQRAGELVARFGGEEFVVLLPEVDASRANRIAEVIRVAVYELGIAHPHADNHRVTVSVGCAALVPHAGEDCHRLVDLADQMLYLAKRAGRNCVRVDDADVEVLLATSGQVRQLQH